MTVADMLSDETVTALAEKSLLAIRARNFLSSDECDMLVQRIEESVHFKFSGPGFVGLGPGEFNLPELSLEYESSRIEIESILEPVLRKFSSVLNLTRPSHGGQILRALTARRYDQSFIAPPHEDFQTLPFAAYQLGISLCLRAPQSGGEIRVWDECFERQTYKDFSSDGRSLDESRIPNHSESFKSEIGELLLLDARRVHAIDQIQSGCRLSVSGFLCPTGSEVLIWS
jgi:hypothetical protein